MDRKIDMKFWDDVDNNTEYWDREWGGPDIEEDSYIVYTKVGLDKTAKPKPRYEPEYDVDEI